MIKIQLHRLDRSRSAIWRHVIFVHGLSGSHPDTWLSRGTDDLWPNWLASDLDGAAIWSIEYSAPISDFQKGNAQALPDRADGILARLEAEDELRKGELYFVGHSMGGILVGYAIHSAVSKSYRDGMAASFVERTRKVVYLGTPHGGSKKASIVPRWLRPSKATQGLHLGDPDLRNMRKQTRNTFDRLKIQSRTFTETKALGFLGIVVDQDSADPGLLGDVVAIDADHSEICKPENRSDAVYVSLLSFLKAPSAVLDVGVGGPTRSPGQVGDPTSPTDFLKDAAIQPPSENKLVDTELRRQLVKFAKARFFNEFDAQKQAERLVAQIETGDLRYAGVDTRAKAMAFCARVLSGNGEKLDCAKVILESVCKLSEPGEHTAIAQAFVVAAEGNVDNAISILAGFETKASRSAAIRLVAAHMGNHAAKTWLEQAGFTEDDLNAEGKCLLLQGDLNEGEWDTALARADRMSDDDFEEAPVLLSLTAATYLAQLVPDESKAFVLEQIPLEATRFRLSMSRMREWNRAAELSRRSAGVLRSLGLASTAAYAEDTALWLDLRNPDPAVSLQGRTELTESVRSDRKTLLRRLHLLINFGVSFDREQVVREIDRETALTGGKSHEAGMARLALTFAERDARGAADYLRSHIEQLANVVDKSALIRLEIEMRARAGQAEEAERLIASAKLHGLKPDEEAHLRRFIGEAAGTDPVEARRRRYESTGTLVDLANLVDILEEQRRWSDLAVHAKTLFDQTGDTQDAARLVQAYRASGDYQAVLAFFDGNLAFSGHSRSFTWSLAWALAEAGNFAKASEVLAPLVQGGSDRKSRELQIEIAIASGEWEALTALVESEWFERSRRSPDELVRAARLGHRLNLHRAKPLTKAAALAGNDDAALLLACYHLATEAGWEREPDTSSWLRRAIELSNSDGPIKRHSIRELLDAKPEWDARQQNWWQSLLKAEMPTFVAAQGSNQTLAAFTLLAAVTNLRERDPRKRHPIFAFSGSRKTLEIQGRRIALDVTAIYTLSFLGVLGTAIRHFEAVTLPYRTMSWIWTESGRIDFHQPSRTRDAAALAILAGTGKVEQFKPTRPMDPLLATEIGEDLAEMLTHAKAEDLQVVVVRPGPLYRVSSLMEAEAELGEYRPFLAGCGDVVEALVREGELSDNDASRARDYFKLNERSWDRQSELSRQDTLYLDDLAVSTFQHLELMDLVASSFRVVVPKTGSRLNQDLLDYQARSQGVSQILEEARKVLRQGMLDGKVTVAGRGVQAQGDGNPENSSHPSVELMGIASQVDGIVVDDRAINKYSEADDGRHSVPTYNTLDLLKTLRANEIVSTQEYDNYLCKLRQACYLFVSVDDRELSDLLSGASLFGSHPREPAALRAFRESVVKARMTDALQPGERVWLEELSDAAIETISKEFESADVEEAETRADYLWDIVNFVGWAHRFQEAPHILDELRRNQIIRLVIASRATPDTNGVFRPWVNGVIERIKERDPTEYAGLLELSASLVENYVASRSTKAGDVDET